LASRSCGGNCFRQLLWSTDLINRCNIFFDMDNSTQQRELQRIEKLANTLDTAVGIPGTRFSVGLDGLIGLVPVVGDTAMLTSGLWIVHRAQKMGIRKTVLTKMLFNLGIDATVGAIPVVGDLFDFFWKANQRNIALVKKEVYKHPLSK
jgi:hypothetical protein